MNANTNHKAEFLRKILPTMIEEGYSDNQIIDEGLKADVSKGVIKMNLLLIKKTLTYSVISASIIMCFTVIFIFLIGFIVTSSPILSLKTMFSILKMQYTFPIVYVLLIFFTYMMSYLIKKFVINKK